MSWHPLYGCLFSIFRTIYNLCSRGTKVFQQSRNDIYFRIITTLFLIFLYQYFSIYSCALSFVSENSFMIFFIVSSLLTLNFFDILIVPLISPSWIPSFFNYSNAVHIFIWPPILFSISKAWLMSSWDSVIAPITNPISVGIAQSLYTLFILS